MPLNRRQFAQGIMMLPLAGDALTRFQPGPHIEPPTLLWEMFALLPDRAPDGEPIQLTRISGEMIFPGELRSTRGILPEQVRPILEADTTHMLDVRPVTPDEHLVRFSGVGLDGIDAIGAFRPCTVYIGDFSTEEVHAAWEDIGYAPTDDPDIWSWKGLPKEEHDADVDETLLVMQQRLSLPPRSRGRYGFLTCLDDRYIVEAGTGEMLRHIRGRFAEGSQGGALTDGALAVAETIQATMGHVTRLYEDHNFVSRRRQESGTDRGAILQRENEVTLASIEDELGRMPRVQSALLGITPGTPWRDPLDPVTLPDIASTSTASVRLESQEDAERYLAIAQARFETLVSWYTGTPFPELFSFEGSNSGSRVSIDLTHLRSTRYDILQMAYFDDLAFLTWEPDDQETWRSAR